MGFFRTILQVIFPDEEVAQTPSTDEEKRKRQMRYHDPGNFTYEEDGFVFQSKTGPVKIKWASVTCLTAYKADMITYDEICMDIIYEDRQLTISEETPGWYQYVEKINQVFPGIPKDWDSTISHPPFATNLTVLYQKKV
jgi:hypothetical protein